MVLPFGLGPDGQHPTASGRAMVPPSAPPAEPHVPTTTVTTVPVIVPQNSSQYIEFIVVNGDDRYVIRCERKAVLENSVELAKIIHAGPNSGRKNDNHFQISNVDKRDFELLIRFLETKFVKYRDHMHILEILELANRFNCPDLVIHCIRELDLQLTSAIVLDVFRSLWYYNSASPSTIHQNQAVTSQEPGKKSSKKSKSTTAANSYPFTPEDHMIALLNNSLQLIDMHAELVLTKEQMTALRFEELEMIAKRDALQLHHSELALFECLADWSLEECQRKKLDPHAENRRRVLGPLCYAPRYLTMSAKEFRKACDRVELLDPAEVSLVADAIDGKKMKNLTPEQTHMLEKFRTPRPEFAKMPIHLSDRSNPKNYPKKMRRAEKTENGNDGCCDNFGMNCLTVFACIFD